MDVDMEDYMRSGNIADDVSALHVQKYFVDFFLEGHPPRGRSQPNLCQGPDPNGSRRSRRLYGGGVRLWMGL